MAAPTVTRTGTATSKTAGTTLAVTLSATSYSLGDYLVVSLAMDPTSGAVSFAKTAGTAVIGAFTNIGDIANGSGTSGVRVVSSYAKVTTAGTITTVTATLPSTTAKAAETFKISGADGTTPIVSPQTTANSNAFPTGGAGVGAAIGHDALAFFTAGGETPGAVAVTTGTDSGWTLTFSETPSVGTTGNASATNIALASAGEERTIGTTSDFASFSVTVAGTVASVGAYWQFIPPIISPGPPVMVLRSVMRASLF